MATGNAIFFGSILAKFVLGKISVLENKIPKGLLWVMRIGVTAIFLLGTLRPNWHLPNIETTIDFDAKRYLYLCVRTFIKDMGFASPDFYITTSFWAGFGWLDVPMPGWFVGGISAIPLMVLSAAVWSGKKITYRHLVLVGGSAFALLSYLLVLAWLAFKVPVNLHGRYLIGFYILYLMQIGLVLKWLCEDRSEVFVRNVFSIGLSLAFIFHGVSAYYILIRYFG